MGNQFTTRHAPPGFDGMRSRERADQAMNRQLAKDAASMLADFGEPVVFTPGGAGSSFTIIAVVDRNPPRVVTEDGHVLSDEIELTFRNGEGGIATVNKGRDSFTVAGRYGGTPKPHTVTAVINGDAGMWTVRAK